MNTYLRYLPTLPTYLPWDTFVDMVECCLPMPCHAMPWPMVDLNPPMPCHYSTTFDFRTHTKSNCISDPTSSLSSRAWVSKKSFPRKPAVAIRAVTRVNASPAINIRSDYPQSAHRSKEIKPAVDAFLLCLLVLPPPHLSSSRPLFSLVTFLRQLASAADLIVAQVCTCCILLQPHLALFLDICLPGESGGQKS